MKTLPRRITEPLTTGEMAQISPAHDNDSLKEGSNCWEETEHSQSATVECKFSMQIDEGAKEAVTCQTYAVSAGQNNFESDSPTEHLQEKSHSASLGCTTPPPNASFADVGTPVVSYTVDPPVLTPMDSAHSVMPITSEDQPPSHPPSSYITNALTKLANVCSEMNHQVDAGVPARAPVFHPCAETPKLGDLVEDIHVQLEGVELWQQFHSVDTEMIITRAGRYGRNVQYETSNQY